jgi:hypothetical protein
MSDELETILRLVSEGKLTPDEAAPIIDALTRAEQSAPRADRIADRASRRASRLDRHMDRAQRRMNRAFARVQATVDDIGGGRHLRIQVKERGRQQVNLRIPIGFVDSALGFVPGLGGDQADRIRQAVRSGETGPIIDVEDDEGGGVLISVE